MSEPITNDEYKTALKVLKHVIQRTRSEWEEGQVGEYEPAEFDYIFYKTNLELNDCYDWVNRWFELEHDDE